jgi:hypothetical protein
MAFKEAKIEWHRESQKPKRNRKSAETIVNQINATSGFDLKPRRVRNAVKKGNIEATPEKRGEKGSIPVKAYKALCGAFESFVKLAA